MSNLAAAMDSEFASDFQKRLLSECHEIMKELRLDYELTTGGLNEFYWKLTTSGQHALEVFLYKEEAGYSLDGAWNLWEAADYPGRPDRLEDVFLAELRAAAGSLASDQARRYGR